MLSVTKELCTLLLMGWQNVWMAQCVGGILSERQNVWVAKCLGGYRFEWQIVWCQNIVCYNVGCSDVGESPWFHLFNILGVYQYQWWSKQKEDLLPARPSCLVLKVRVGLLDLA